MSEETIRQLSGGREKERAREREGKKKLHRDRIKEDTVTTVR